MLVNDQAANQQELSSSESESYEETEREESAIDIKVESASGLIQEVE